MKRFIVAAWCLACSTSPTENSQEGLLPADFRSNGFVEARTCRAPGEHSALGGFKVWVSSDARKALEDLWAGKLGVMPNETVVAKEIFSGPDCAEPDLVATLTMKKISGAAPADGDWLWEERDASGHLARDASTTGCITCHEGKASCSGYGADGTKDYLCTEP